MAVGDQPLTVEENRIRLQLDSALVGLYQAVYRRVKRAASEHKNLRYLAHALDQRQDQIWIDSWGHVTPVGNKLIAEAMLREIKDQLVNTDNRKPDRRRSTTVTATLDTEHDVKRSSGTSANSGQ